MKIWETWKEFNLWMWNHPNPLGKINVILTYVIPIAMVISVILVYFGVI